MRFHAVSAVAIVAFCLLAPVEAQHEQFDQQQKKHIRIIGAGFSRTGTASLAQALTHFGFNVYHGVDFRSRRPEWYFWSQVLRREGFPGPYEEARDVLLDHLLDQGFDTFLDSPASDLWQAQFGHSPDAKVILSVREPLKWAESMLMLRNNLDIPHRAWWKKKPFRWFPPFHNLRVIMQYIHLKSCGRLLCAPEGHELQLQRSMELMKNRTAEVIRTVPEEQLLIWDPAEGWAPLCRFLGVAECPTIDFPVTNEREAWKLQAAQHGEVSRVLQGIEYMEYIWLPLASIVMALITALVLHASGFMNWGGGSEGAIRAPEVLSAASSDSTSSGQARRTSKKTD